MSFSGIDKGEIGSDEGTQNGPAEDGDRITADQFADKGVLAGFEDCHDVSLHQVEILLTEFIRLVLDLAGVVSNDERRLPLLRHFVVFVILVDGIELLQQRLIGGAGKTGQERKDVKKGIKTTGKGLKNRKSSTQELANKVNQQPIGEDVCHDQSRTPRHIDK